jgi:hypothetical protein
MNTSPHWTNSIEMARVAASSLSQEVFQAAEILHAKGEPFEKAKLAALEERIPAIMAEYDETVADLVVHMVMEVPESGVHPKARARYRDHRWNRLVAPLVSAGGSPPPVWERKLFEWFGRLPSGLRGGVRSGASRG